MEHTEFYQQSEYGAPLSYRDLMGEFRCVFDAGDPWGSTINVLFDVAAELDHRSSEVPSREWQYRKGSLAPADCREPDSYFYAACLAAPTEALEKFGRVLNRYDELLRRAGLSY